MNTKWMLIVIILLFVCSLCSAEMCGRLAQVSAGEDHSLALTNDGSLLACGSNGLYQLGIGLNTSSFYTLRDVNGINGVGKLKNIAVFDAGWTHSLAADVNGVLTSWGTDNYGQLGNGGTGQTDFNVPQKVKGLNDQGYLSDTYRIVAVSAGRSGLHSLVVDSNGYVYGFGFNSTGQCGDGNATTTNRQYPVKVLDDDANTPNGYLGDVAKIIAVEAGGAHSLALSDPNSGGYVFEWGSNNGSPYPRKVPNFDGNGYLRNIRGISSCYHSVAVDSNGFVYEWESWTPGNLTIHPRQITEPNGYGTLSNIKMVAAGYNYYSMALDNNGRVWLWSFGGNPSLVACGQMQTQSGCLENIASIAFGFYDHKLAVDNQGYGWAWGSGDGSSSGQLGVGDNALHPTPVKMACPKESGQVFLTKTYTIDGNEQCVRPFLTNNYLRFNISYSNPVTNPADPNYIGTLYDVNIVDVLPFEVDFYNANNGAIYNSTDRTVTLHVGTLSPGSSGSFQIITKVNKHALPGDYFQNYAYLDARNYWAMSDVNVPVCNWGGTIVYVDRDANSGFNNGTSWDDAFLDLQDGIAAAERLEGDIAAIWVAAGIYKPVDSMITGYQNKTFKLPDNVALIGHFGGKGTYETNASQRNLTDANKIATLDGQIGTQSSQSVSKVITASNVYNGLIDGFKIKGGSGTGVYLDNSNVSILNCRFENTDYGVQATNYSYPDIHNCTFLTNRSYGVYASSYCQPGFSYCTFDGNNVAYSGISTSSCATTVQNSIFKKYTNNAIYGNSNGSLDITDSQVINNSAGFNLSNITTNMLDCTVKNNTGNGLSASDCYLYMMHCIFERNNQYGIYMQSGSDLTSERSIIRYNGYHGFSLNNNVTTSIKNCWIHKNGTQHNSSYGAGIYLAGPVQTPIIRNDTIYDNWTYGIQCSQIGADLNIRNCILYGNVTNDVNWPGHTFGNINYCLLQHACSGNITGDPLFILSDANDLHIDDGSPCFNAGDPCDIYPNEQDIDDENRVYYGRVDIGADENFWSSADYNRDGIVNFQDFALLAGVWGTSSETYNLANGTIIDNNDLAVFCADWLWQKQPALGWLQAMQSGGSGSMSMMMTMDENESQMESMPETLDDPLMITDMQTSRTLMPTRLARRADAFYWITAAVTEPPPPPSPTIYLAYDGSMTPDPNTEVTVYVYSDIPLFSMDMIVTVTGDATITTAMGSYDCNDYGWDSEWGYDPYIDPSGWVQFGGTSWAGQAIGTVGYFKFIYNSGQVAVSIAADSYAYDTNSQPAAFSTDPLIFGGESMQSEPRTLVSGLSEEQAMDSTPAADVNELADWLEQLWLEDAEIRATDTPEEWQQFIDNLRSGQYQ